MAWRLEDHVISGELDFCQRGRVLIEAAGWKISIDTDPTWNMSGEEELQQIERNAESIRRFMESIDEAFDPQA